MAMTMMLQACTVARPSAASLKSSFKGLSLKSSTAPMSLAATPRLVVQPAAAAGYKLKTHKASAKRFSVTGSGKITRRCAGRAHLLRKKTTTRKNRLSGKTEVKHCDWQNVIGALPYLKTKK
jgi:large subunit ribosomal protein L35